MIPYEEYSMLVKKGFANSGMLVTRRNGETGPRISEETQPTPTNYDKAGITVILPKYGYKWYREYYASKPGQEAPGTAGLSAEQKNEGRCLQRGVKNQ